MKIYAFIKSKFVNDVLVELLSENGEILEQFIAYTETKAKEFSQNRRKKYTEIYQTNVDVVWQDNNDSQEIRNAKKMYGHNNIDVDYQGRCL